MPSTRHRAVNSIGAELKRTPGVVASDIMFAYSWIAEPRSKIPNYKHQIANKYQITSTKPLPRDRGSRFWDLVLGICLDFVIWSLDFRFRASLRPSRWPGTGSWGGRSA